MVDQLYKNQSYTGRTSRNGRSQREAPNRLRKENESRLPRFVKVVSVEGRSLALFRVKDEYFAIANVCLHRGGPLGEGNLSGSVVTCPWHGWNFDVRTGSFTVIPTLKVATYKVKEQDGSVMVE